MLLPFRPVAVLLGGLLLIAASGRWWHGRGGDVLRRGHGGGRPVRDALLRDAARRGAPVRGRAGRALREGDGGTWPILVTTLLLTTPGALSYPLAGREAFRVLPPTVPEVPA